MCKVSVIIPVFQVEQYLERCLSSVLAQTYRDFEIILVDDGSTDGSPAICDCYARENENITVIHQKNGGLANARKSGFEAASGEYILFVDSDDYIESTMLQRMFRSIEMEKADICLCGFFKETALGAEPVLLPLATEPICEREEIVERYIKPLLGKAEEEKVLPGFLCIRLLKRSLIQRSFFASEREYYLEDHVFDLLYADNIRRIAYVNEPLYHYCFNPKSLSNCHRKGKWGMYRRLYFFYEDYAKCRHLKGCEGNLKNFLFSSFGASVDNAILSGSFEGYCEELAEILRDALFDRISVLSSIWRTPRLGVTLLLLRLHLRWVVYVLRRHRMGKNSKLV